MGLFDNLFKASPDAADEAVVEAAKRIAEHEKARLLEASKVSSAPPAMRTGIVPTHKPGSVPAPRAYSPRSLGQVVTPGRMSGESMPASPRKIRFTAHEETERPSEVVLSVEDVLARIPIDLISDQPPDLRRELRFKVEDLSADIARGRAAVPLGRIAAQVPELFREPIASDDPRQVRLPLQKLVEQIGFLPARPAPPVEPPAEPALPPPPGPGSVVPAEQTVLLETPVPLPNVRISLNLAAILRTCPRDLIVAELPPIPEHDRISFPWGPIEKQLQTGEVEVSSVRFIFALPAYLQGYFEAREGIRVPLPLDEVRNNIPTHAPPPPPPIEPARPQAAAQAETPEPPLDQTPIPDVVFVRAGMKAEPAPAEPETPIEVPEDFAVESEIEAHPLDLPPPVVAHVPPILSAEPEPEAPPPIPPISEIEAPAEPLEPPPIYVPPPLLQTGDTVAPAPVETQLAPPNVWMQPPPEIPARPTALWPPDVLPPQSPMLPVRITTPPVVRPVIAPPPLWKVSGFEFRDPEPETQNPEPETQPPPPRPLDLEVARAAFGLEGDATLADIGAVLTRLPGLSACFLAVRHESAHGGELPAGFDPEAARTLARQLSHSLEGTAERLGSGRVQHVTIFAEDSCVSFFTQGEATVCAIHRTRAFLPGVREKLAAAATALAQA